MDFISYCQWDFNHEIIERKSKPNKVKTVWALDVSYSLSSAREECLCLLYISSRYSTTIRIKKVENRKVSTSVKLPKSIKKCNNSIVTCNKKASNLFSASNILCFPSFLWCHSYNFHTEPFSRSADCYSMDVVFAWQSCVRPGLLG